uniref:Uncharacterized protein n=1 Tax=Rhipicephalus appendiculatus TaxID=34631 RepID=A0A131YBP8_RHIAP
MIMRDGIVEGSGNVDYLGLFNVHLNLSTRASSIFASFKMRPPWPGFDPATLGSAVQRHNHWVSNAQHASDGNKQRWTWDWGNDRRGR